MSEESSGGESNANKVVPFPRHRVKKASGVGISTLVQAERESRRRVILVVSILATVLVSTFISNRMAQNPENSLRELGDRIIASVSRRSLDEDISLAKKIARESLREPASAGREPTAEDLLRDGELAGLYALTFNDEGALTGLNYVMESGRERYVEDRDQFLRRHSDLLRIEFDLPVLAETVSDKKYKYEVYELKKADEVKARVHFKTDQRDTLYSMKVEKL